MADVPEWEPRVRVLEEIAASTKTLLSEMRSEITGLRRDMTAGFGELRRDMTGGFGELRRDMTIGFGELRQAIERVDQRRERDFRWVFGAIIVTTLGLAALIARTQHWI